jgi:enolase
MIGLGHAIQRVGDDRLITNANHQKHGIDEKSANSTRIKGNQIGTVTDTIDGMEIAKSASFRSIVSHHSGVMEDTTSASIAVAANIRQTEGGSMSETDPICRYNGSLCMEDYLDKYRG